MDGSRSLARRRSHPAFDGAPPDPGTLIALDDVAERLRLLKVWAGDPSFETIKERIGANWTAAGRPAAELPGKTTVADCLRSGRRRLNTDLVVGIVQALHPDTGYVTQWRQALEMIGSGTTAAAQVRVFDELPPEAEGFTGRAAELDRLLRVLLDEDRAGVPVTITALEGMAGVGKTELAVQAGHRLHRRRPLDRVLFVNLRGFHPDPAQPPAEPAAVLDGFLRLLGVAGQKIPHDLTGRAALYRELLAGTRTLVVLDNAADAGQVRPLLPADPGCPVLVTSRRSLSGLRPATRLAVDVFTPDEARQFLSRAAPDVPVGEDPLATTRIVRRCGHLPLALGLFAGHMRTRAGWTLTDHADRLDERARERRLDDGVELALELSYRNLPADRKRLFRLAALPPAQDLDAYAAAALADTGLDTAETDLERLADDHLLLRGEPGRYTFHDLVRAYAVNRSHDEDRSADRRAALTRLFDHYLSTAARAMDALLPTEADLRPPAPPTTTPRPPMTGSADGRDWLNAERASLVTAVGYTAAHGWPEHTVRLSTVLFRHLAGSYPADALTVHTRAREVARQLGDHSGEAWALTGLGAAYLRLGRHEQAAERYRESGELFHRIGDRAGEGRVSNCLGIIEKRRGRYPAAVEHYRRSLPLFRAAGDRIGEADTLNNLGVIADLMGQPEEAVEHQLQALALHRQTGDRIGEADSLNDLGLVETKMGRLHAAEDHIRQALVRYRQIGERAGEAHALDNLGMVRIALGDPVGAAEPLRRSLAIFQDVGDRVGEAWAFNSLAEAARTAGAPGEARAHATGALAAAVATRIPAQEARAHTTLGRAGHDLGDHAAAREHYEKALALHTELGGPEADEVRGLLADLDKAEVTPR